MQAFVKKGAQKPRNAPWPASALSFYGGDVAVVVDMRNPKVLYTVNGRELAAGTRLVFSQLDYSLAGPDAWMMNKDDVHAAFLDKYAVGELVEFTQSMGERQFCLPWPPVSEFVRILAAFEGAPARAPMRVQHLHTHPHTVLHASHAAHAAHVRAPEPQYTKGVCVRELACRELAGSPIWIAALGRMEEFSVDDLAEVDMSEGKGDPTSKHDAVEMGAYQAGEADAAADSGVQVAPSVVAFFCLCPLFPPRASGPRRPGSAQGLYLPDRPHRTQFHSFRRPARLLCCC